MSYRIGKLMRVGQTNAPSSPALLLSPAPHTLHLGRPTPCTPPAPRCTRCNTPVMGKGSAAARSRTSLVAVCRSSSTMAYWASLAATDLPQSSQPHLAHTSRTSLNWPSLTPSRKKMRCCSAARGAEERSGEHSRRQEGQRAATHQHDAPTLLLPHNCSFGSSAG